MKAFVRESAELEAAAVIDVAERPPGPGEVVLRVSHCGLCGSDLRIHYTDSTSFSPPLVMGHEYAGTVVAVGSGVAPTLLGTNAVVVSIQECGSCPECRVGNTNVCAQRRIPGWSYDGGLAEYSVVPADGIVEVPEGMPLSLAALVEPMAVGVHAAGMAGALPAGRAVISGPGPIGIFTGLALKYQGWDVMVVGIASDAPRRLPTAASMGLSTDVIDENGVVDLGNFANPTLWVEASGSPAGLQLAMAHLRPEGLMTVVGIPHGAETYDLRVGMRKGLTIKFSYAYRRADYARAFEVLSAGLVNERELLDVYPLGDTLRALDDARHGRIMKPMIRIGD
jgi:threonine dehydrogenase-like Zn-dependent dehydrogenase